ncbi:gamma-glutamyl-gamma-aminobutyrate hydrolase family protein [Alphaproteobacteria bacterium]|jgi:putative glutamine amidotransferase|nr:gamma-glutamyl-gamma-aminobutyrate hydrolase family protein [Alphaproteobacteria bacterium]|tara:strand:+ start:194 stop:901 length:708 start_codon:yes stop_codon:yes gene_type:complete
MKKPLIALTLDYETSKGYSNYPWYAIRENYFTSIEESGGIGVGIPHNMKDIVSLLHKIDGLVITGGNFDIDPNIFGESSVHKTVKLKENRTNFELLAAEIMLKQNKPVLGICGGEQLINVLYKGSLIQHIPDEIKNPIEHEQKNPRNEAGHSVTIQEHTKLYSIISKQNIMVNSAHHQAIKVPGKGLIVNALSNDGVIEGIEDPKKTFCIGVQWHPEFFIQGSDNKLLKAFINAC